MSVGWDLAGTLHKVRCTLFVLCLGVTTKPTANCSIELVKPQQTSQIQPPLQRTQSVSVSTKKNGNAKPQSVLFPLRMTHYVQTESLATFSDRRDACWTIQASCPAKEFLKPKRHVLKNTSCTLIHSRTSFAEDCALNLLSDAWYLKVELSTRWKGTCRMCGYIVQD